jgi:hypothetical protein
MDTFGLSQRRWRILYLVVDYLEITVFVGLNDVIKHTRRTLRAQAEESARMKKLQLHDASATPKTQRRRNEIPFTSQRTHAREKLSGANC